MGRYQYKHAYPSRDRGSVAAPWMIWVYFPGSLVFLELMLHLTAGLSRNFAAVMGAGLTAISAGFLLCLLSTLTCSAKANRWIGFGLLELVIIWFLIAYFTDNSYQVFMDPQSILSGAGDVVTGFGSTLVSVIVKGIPVILLYHLPVAGYLLLEGKAFSCRHKNIRQTALFLAVCLAFWGLGAVASTRGDVNARKYNSEYRYDSAVRSFGLLTAFRLDTRQMLRGSDDLGGFEQVDEPAMKDDTPSDTMPEVPGDIQPGEEPGEDTPIVPEEPEEPVREYGWHEMDIDFDALIAETSDTDLQAIHSYVSGLEPARENEYTGLFAGKNLILITAEAFSKEVIDPELTPTLYRLANQGIVFEDYYQPAWGGSTSTGEYSMLTGLVPTAGVKSMKRTIGQNLYFTMGNQLMRQGYTSKAYHNGSYTYYSRNETHTNFGYSTFTGMGNGMEEGVAQKWPESDKEMMDFTVSQYIDQQPFSVYYMTVSGHCLYSWSGNSMSSRNREAVADMDASETIKAYYAANLELEYGLASLVQQLEDAGIANDTVIALTTDHYPYGLEKGASWGNDEDYLSELYGYPADSYTARDHSALIIWSGCLEEREEPIVVSTPTYSLDLLPTLSNLFGLEYDSRLLVGRDALSDEEPLVLWTDYDWLTDRGYYDSSKGEFTLAEGAEPVDDDYISRIRAKVKNKIKFSRAVLDYDYYGILFNE